MKVESWTSREVHFICIPRTTSEECEELVDAALDKYWDKSHNSRSIRSRLFEPAISLTRKTLIVEGWPWWTPAWFARRSVAAIATKRGIGGDAEYRRVRTVLVSG